MIFINNQDVEKILTMEDTLRVIEGGHAELAKGELVGRPRIDIYTQTSLKERFHRWGTMEGSSKGLHRHAIRMKSDIVSWLAIINDGYLQHLRVGALYGLGVKYLARTDASVVGMIGSGGMARSHLMAFAAVRKIKKAKVYSPNREHRELYAKEMEQRLGLEVIPCSSPEEAARGVHILATCTNSREPTVFAKMLEPGMHLTQVAKEFAGDVYPKLNICVGGGPMSQIAGGVPVDDSKGFPTYLAGSLETLNEARDPTASRRDEKRDFNGRLVSLVDLITHKTQGRLNDSEISASRGITVGGEDTVKGLQFVTVSSLVYDLAKKANLGREVPTEWFLQDIRD